MTPDPCASARQASGGPSGSASSAPPPLSWSLRTAPAADPGCRPSWRAPPRRSGSSRTAVPTTGLGAGSHGAPVRRDQQQPGDGPPRPQLRVPLDAGLRSGLVRQAFKLSDVDSVWYGVEPFGTWDGPAHTLLSFGLPRMAPTCGYPASEGGSLLGLEGTLELLRDRLRDRRRADVIVPASQPPTERCLSLPGTRRARRHPPDPGPSGARTRSARSPSSTTASSILTAILGHVDSVAREARPGATTCLSLAFRPAGLHLRLDRSKPLDSCAATHHSEGPGLSACADFSSRIRGALGVVARRGTASLARL